MRLIPEDKRWEAATAVVREMIRYRRFQALSDEVIHCDPTGTLILHRTVYDQIKLGMTLNSVVRLVGSNPYHIPGNDKVAWSTLGGSYLRLGVDNRTKEIFRKSFSDIIARSCGIAGNFDEQSGNKPENTANHHATNWPSVSTEDAVTYFLVYANNKQRKWLQEAMTPAVNFKIARIAGRSSIEFIFNFNSPSMTKPSSLEQISLERAKQMWRAILELAPIDALRARNRIMSIIGDCDYFATSKSRKALLELIKQGNLQEAEQMRGKILDDHQTKHFDSISKKVRKREKAGAIYGRDYEKDSEKMLWGWYQSLVYRRDDYRCQYCGTVNTEHENPLYHIDHIIPVSRGGKTELANLQLLCEPCNLSKAARLEEEQPKVIQEAWFKNRGK